MFFVVFQAKRVGVNCIILPEENKKDFNDLPKYITDGLEVHFVSTIEDVYRICFSDDNFETKLDSTVPFHTIPTTGAQSINP